MWAVAEEPQDPGTSPVTDQRRRCNHVFDVGRAQIEAKSREDRQFALMDRHLTLNCVIPK
jgi:hypothetical protein